MTKRGFAARLLCSLAIFILLLPSCVFAEETASSRWADAADKIDQFAPMVCILDFKGVGFMDSSGIAVVIHTYRRMTERQGVLILKKVPPQPKKVLEAAGMDRLVSIEGREKVYEV